MGHVTRPNQPDKVWFNWTKAPLNSIRVNRRSVHLIVNTFLHQLLHPVLRWHSLILEFNFSKEMRTRTKRNRSGQVTYIKTQRWLEVSFSKEKKTFSGLWEKLWVIWVKLIEHICLWNKIRWTIFLLFFPNLIFNIIYQIELLL